MAETVLVISDLQAPYHHPDAFDFLDVVNNVYKPTQIVCIGDEVDFHSISGFDPSPDAPGPGDETRAAIRALQPLYNLFPTVKACTSNHTERPFLKAFKAGIPRSMMKDYNTMLEAPRNWEWRKYWIIDGIRYEHGHKLAGGLGMNVARTAPLALGRSVVFGHFHTHAGIHWSGNPDQLMFGMNVGCLIDHRSFAFDYMRHTTRPILGCGIVDEGIPAFIPMRLNKRGRWARRLRGV